MADLFAPSLVIPQNLRFYLHRLADDAQPATNILKINAMNSTSASSGGLITVRLPMALVDLNSFAMFFCTNVTNGTTNGTTGTGLSTAGNDIAPGILPKGIESLISRLEVSVNGLGLLNLQQYNLLYAILKDSHMDTDKSMMRRQLQNEVDTMPLYVSSATTPAPVGSTQVIHGTVAAGGVSGSGSQTATITVVCDTLYPGITTGACVSVGNLNYADIGLTAPTAASGLTITNTVTGVKVVPSYVQTVNSQTIYGPMVTQLTISSVVAGTGAGNWTYANPLVPKTVSFVVCQPYLQGASAGASTAGAVATTGLNSPYGTSAPFVGTTPYYIPNQNHFHCINDWLSFFKAAPNWLQTQMLGEVEVRITLQDNSVLLVPPDASLQTRPDFSLNNIYFTIRTCSFDNNFYDDILHAKLADGGEIEIPYSNYFNVNQTQSAGASSTRFSINTQCLNKVIGVNRPSYYNTTAGAMMHVPCGYGVKSDGSMGIVHKGAFFQTYAPNPAPFTATALTQPNYWQYQINNSFVPNVKIDPSFNYYNHLEAWNLHNDWLSSTIQANPAIFLNSGYQMAVALDFQDSSIPRLLSGIDTRGAVSVAYLNQDNNNNGDRTDIFTCFTSILRVGANQQIQVVY